MKASKTIITQHLLLVLFLQAIFVVAIALPQLQRFREMAEQTLRLQDGMIWIVLFAVLFVSTATLLSRLRNRISTPLSLLVEQTKLGTSSYAFKTKSMVAEEDFLKHYIEGQAMRFLEMEQEVQHMQSQLEKAEAISKISPEEYQSLHSKLAKTAAAAEQIQEMLTQEKEAKSKLENTLKSTEKALSQTARELESARPGKNGSDTEFASQSLTDERLGKITKTLSQINKVSRRLARAWSESSPAEMRDGFVEISRQSEEQLDNLNDESASA